MGQVEKSIEVDCPVSVCYNQWTQFESFPKFMEGVKEVRQLDDQRLHWTAEIAGKVTEWDARIVEQRPDERIEWTNTSGARNAGVVTFRAVDQGHCEVTLELDFEPDGALETLGDALGVVDHRIKADLKRFKEFCESQGNAEGGWRGEIHQGSGTAPSQTTSPLPGRTGTELD